MDWALQSRSAACVELLVAEAKARGLQGGRGDVAPLRTLMEHYYGVTDQEMEANIKASNARLRASLSKGAASKGSAPRSVIREVWDIPDIGPAQLKPT